MENLLENLHREKSIGIKKLTDADLGLSWSSHQTHIGLSAKVFTFMNIHEYYSDSILLYNNTWYQYDCYVDKIVRYEGVGASKIRKGEYGLSVVDKIWSIVHDSPHSGWYLIWFALKSERPVFVLIKNGSDDYRDFCTFLSSTMSVYKSYNTSFYRLVDKIDHKLSRFKSWKENEL